MLPNTIFIAKYKVEELLPKQYGSISDLVEFLKPLDKVGLDIETGRDVRFRNKENKTYRGGLDPFLSQIVSLQIGNLTTVFNVDVRDFTKEELKPVLDILNWNDDLLIVGQNLKFEGKHLLHKYGIALKNVYDTMLAEMILYNGLNPAMDLAGMAVKYLGATVAKPSKLFEDEIKGKTITLDEAHLENNPHAITPFEVADMQEIDKSTRMQFVRIDNRPMTFEQITYGVDDVIYPLLIMEKQLLGHENITGELFQPINNIRLRSKFTQVLAEMELNGLPFTESIWEELLVQNKAKLKDRLHRLNEATMEMYPEFRVPSLFGGSDCIVDWGSSKSVVNFLRKVGECPKEKSKSTKKLAYTVGADALSQLFNADQRARVMKNNCDFEIKTLEDLLVMYLLVNKSTMLTTTYGVEFLKYKHPITGRLHPNYRAMLATGRVATFKPNVLAIPESHRIAMTLEGSNRSMLVYDYSSQESRVLAALSGDLDFVNFFNNGHPIFGSDFHSFTADKVERIQNPSNPLKFVHNDHPDFTPEMKSKRQNVKSVNFGIPYGISAIALSRQLGITQEVAEGLMRSYYEAFPGLASYLSDQRAAALGIGYFKFGTKNVESIYIFPNWSKIVRDGDKNKAYFFTDEYRDLSLDEREVYKKELYAKHPEIKERYSRIGTAKSRLGNKSNNYPIQGTSSNQSVMAMVMLREWKWNNEKYDYQFCCLLHDEIVAECLDENKEEYGKKQLDSMVFSAEYYCPNVKFEATGGASKGWSH